MFVYVYSSLRIVTVVTSFRLVSPATTGSMVCWVFIAKHFLLRHVISLPVWSDFLWHNMYAAVKVFIKISVLYLFIWVEDRVEKSSRKDRNPTFICYLASAAADCNMGKRSCWLQHEQRQLQTAAWANAAAVCSLL